MGYRLLKAGCVLLGAVVIADAIEHTGKAIGKAISDHKYVSKLKKDGAKVFRINRDTYVIINI